jgi:hypothetical protein
MIRLPALTASEYGPTARGAPATEANVSIFFSVIGSSSISILFFSGFIIFEKGKEGESRHWYNTRESFVWNPS